MKAIKLNLNPLEQYIVSLYGNDVKTLATELRKLALDYARVNLLLGASGEGYISDDSSEYLELLTNISDAIDKSIK